MYNSGIYYKNPISHVFPAVYKHMMKAMKYAKKITI